MKLWLLTLMFLCVNSFAQTAIVYDETISRFVDRDLSYMAGDGSVTSLYRSNRIWNRSELDFTRTTDEVLAEKYDKVLRVTENKKGLYYFKNYDLNKLVNFLDHISFSVSYILILDDGHHSLDIIPLIKKYAASRGITIHSETVKTKFGIERAITDAQKNQRGIILNFALAVEEQETGTVLTYNEISKLVAVRNVKHLVVGLNRSNAVCLCETKDSMLSLLSGGEIEFDVVLNATRLEEAGQEFVVLDGVHLAKEVNFE